MSRKPRKVGVAEQTVVVESHFRIESASLPSPVRHAGIDFEHGIIGYQRTRDATPGKKGAARLAASPERPKPKPVCALDKAAGRSRG